MKIGFGLAVAVLSLAVSSAHATEMLEVKLGYSQVIGPVANMATVIVGNDRVADATLGGGGTIILTGRALGATNLIVLDERGRQVLESPLQVVPVDPRPRINIRIVKGITKAQDYDCGQNRLCKPVAVAVAAPPTPADTGPVDGTPAVSPEAPAAPDGTPAAAPEAPTAPDGGDTDAPVAASPGQVSLNP